MSSEDHGLQNLIFQISLETKVHENKDYVGHCVACRKVVERKLMTYKNNRLFHPSCFDQHGNEYQATTNLMVKQNSDRIDLVQLKNLNVRISNQNITKRSSSQKRKSSKKPKKKKTKRKLARKKTAPKKRKVSRKFSVKRRRPKRRTSRPKVKRSSKKRKAKRRR
ncbi:MAG: putative Histone H1 DNA binding protein [Nitrosopumilales archaeon]|nr:MAG: putative Histone H1 DNA binding protein [Nitrosopumilales archaeon]